MADVVGGHPANGAAAPTEDKLVGASEISAGAGLGRVRSTEKSGVAVFYLLAYGFSWAWLGAVALSGGRVSSGSGWPTHFPALLGPLMAAVIVTSSREGRLGLADLARRMVKAGVPKRWWLFALSPLLLLLVVLLLDAALGLPLPRLADFAEFSGLPSRWGALAVAGTILVVNGFGEETGWRGYAFPHLQRIRSPLAATLIVAVLWAGWHAPMFFVVSSFRTMGAPMILGWTIALVCGAIVLSWLYNRSGGSILLIVIWHGTYNLISGTAAAPGLLAATATTLVVMLATCLVILELRAAHRGGRTVLGSRN
jgi:membrane protease YdiL (CAAX protease family)